MENEGAVPGVPPSDVGGESLNSPAENLSEKTSNLTEVPSPTGIVDTEDNNANTNPAVTNIGEVLPENTFEPMDTDSVDNIVDNSEKSDKQSEVGDSENNIPERGDSVATMDTADDIEGIISENSQEIDGETVSKDVEDTESNLDEENSAVDKIDEAGDKEGSIDSIDDSERKTDDFEHKKDEIESDADNISSKSADEDNDDRDNKSALVESTTSEIQSGIGDEVKQLIDLDDEKLVKDIQDVSLVETDEKTEKTVEKDGETSLDPTEMETDVDTVESDLAGEKEKSTPDKSKSSEKPSFIDTDKDETENFPENLDCDPIAELLSLSGSTPSTSKTVDATEAEATEEATEGTETTETTETMETTEETEDNEATDNTAEMAVETEDAVNTLGKENSETILPDAEVKLITTEGTTHEIVKTNPDSVNTSTSPEECIVCLKETSPPLYECLPGFVKDREYLCSQRCLERLRAEKAAVPVREIRVRAFATSVAQDDIDNAQARLSSSSSKQQHSSAGTETRKCANCRTAIDTDSYFTWEAAEFCTQNCFMSYQTALFQNCSYCNIDIPKSYYGKYCVRFGQKINQFCNTHCLAQYKKVWLFCSFCQENLASVKERQEGVMEGFCSRQCVEMVHGGRGKEFGLCSVCHKNKLIEIEFSKTATITETLCSDPCFVAFKFVNNLDSDLHQCITCNKYFNCARMIAEHRAVMCYDGAEFRFCAEDCRKIFLISNRKIVMCMYCRVKKYNFDMIKYTGETEYTVCSQNCLQLYQEKLLLPLGPTAPLFTENLSALLKELTHHQTKTPMTKILLNRPKAPPPRQRNIGTMCKPNVISKAITCKPREAHVGIQTDKAKNIIFVPIPVPIYVPMPVHMFVDVCPMPVPIPITIPVPVFIPTNRKSINGIFKEISKIKNKVPEDPLEAELLMMADIAAGDKKDESSSDSEPDDFSADPGASCPSPGSDSSRTPLIQHLKTEEDNNSTHLYHHQHHHQQQQQQQHHHNLIQQSAGGLVLEGSVVVHHHQQQQQQHVGFVGEDVLQMALKMASDFDEPVDLEGAVSATHISAQAHESGMGVDSAQRIESIMDNKRKNIRQGRTVKTTRPRPDPSTLPPSLLLDAENKPDANLCLKYTFGVNAWKQWVTTKNAELIKTVRKPKLFKTDLLQLTTDDLNYSLCLFVREVRKPNGTEYAPDTIYYLSLGIQQYLYENGRIDNLFCDVFYESFTAALNEVCVKFAALYNESQYIVTRVEEEHLWESKQLGAHSPLVLLNTLMFFNTKHFSLTTVEEHLQLSFSHIMKHWKRNPNQPGARHVLLRFYPPQASSGSTSDNPDAVAVQSRKKRVYEQQENDVNPLRCPVKLYEFYLSKCPESVKTRNDVFYLQPERSCVPDSPVWYSTMALSREPLEKMLNRVKMVKEINIALLST